MQHAYIQLIFNFSIFKVQKGHKRSNHGDERSYGQAQKKNVVTNDILGCSAFFWYTSCICSKILTFEVIRGQWRSAWGHSFDLSLVWTYFHCNTAVFSFHLICNMPIFKWFLFFFIFLRSVNWGQKLWPLFRGQTRSWTLKAMPDSENMGQNRGGWTSREAF